MLHPFTFSARVCPVAVRASPSISHVTIVPAALPDTPPASCRVLDMHTARRLNLQRWGHLTADSVHRIQIKFNTRASLAMAGKGAERYLLIHPRAISRATGICESLFHQNVTSTNALAEQLHHLPPRIFGQGECGAALTAGNVPFPGEGPIPGPQRRQFMVLAVNIPEQEPQPGQAASSSSSNSSGAIFPACTAPTPSKMVLKLTSRPLETPRPSWGRR